MALPYNLAAERVRLGWSLEQAAQELDVKPELLAQWEKDIAPMPAKTLQIASRVYGCSMDYLVGLTEERLP